MAYRSLDTSPQTPMVWWKVFLLVIIPSLVVFLIMDLTWIYFVASAMFKLVLGSLMRTTPNPISGLLAWAFIITGIYYFASRTATSIQSAGLQGLLLGMVIYGTYEFTNHSVIKTWTWGLAFGDFAWGSFACACASVVQYVLLTWK